MMTIEKRLNKICSICGKVANVKIYSDKTYRGGNFFGKIGISTKREIAKTRKAGTHPWNFQGTILQVMNKDPKPYKYTEYWECPKCYWS